MLPLPLRGSDDKPSGSSVGRGRGQIKSLATISSERAVLKVLLWKMQILVMSQSRCQPVIKGHFRGHLLVTRTPRCGLSPLRTPRFSLSLRPRSAGPPGVGPRSPAPQLVGGAGPRRRPALDIRVSCPSAGCPASHRPGQAVAPSTRRLLSSGLPPLSGPRSPCHLLREEVSQ